MSNEYAGRSPLGYAREGAVEVLYKLVVEKFTPQELGMRFCRVSTAGVGCYALGRLLFTQYECDPGDWAWGRQSDNGVSLRIYGKTIDGQIYKAVWKYNSYTKFDTPSKEYTPGLSWEEEIAEERRILAM